MMMIFSDVEIYRKVLLLAYDDDGLSPHASALITGSPPYGFAGLIFADAQLVSF